MKKLSVSLTADHVDALDERQEKDSVSSRSAAVRDILDEYETVRTECDSLRTECEQLRTECERLRDRAAGADDLEAENEQLQQRVDDLETELDRVRNEKRLLLEEREEKAELVSYVEQERTAEQRWREAGLWTRAKWKVLGMPADESNA